MKYHTRSGVGLLILVTNYIEMTQIWHHMEMRMWLIFKFFLPKWHCCRDVCECVHVCACIFRHPFDVYIWKTLIFYTFDWIHRNWAYLLTFFYYFYFSWGWISCIRLNIAYVYVLLYKLLFSQNINNERRSMLNTYTSY